MSQRKTKYFTLMVVPHSQDSVRRIRIPWTWIQTSCLFLIGIMLSAGYFYWDYGRIRSQLPELHHLREVNQRQQNQIESLADQATDLQEKLMELDQLELRVRELLDDGSATAAAETRPAAVVASRSLDRDERLDAAPGREHDQVVAQGGVQQEGEQEASVPAVADTFENIEAMLEPTRESLEDMIQALEERQAYLEAKPSLWPTQGRVTSRYGYRSSPFTGRREFHEGIDIAARTGTRVVATGGGVVTFAGWRSGYGLTVIIDHGYGYRTLYAHNSRLAVKARERVEKGQVIAYVGSTGQSTGPHLHYEVHVNGRHQNPANFLP